MYYCIIIIFGITFTNIYIITFLSHDSVKPRSTLSSSTLTLTEFYPKYILYYYLFASYCYCYTKSPQFISCCGVPYHGDTMY